MTEAEWLNSNNPQTMLQALRGRRGLGRKRRLFAIACCRLILERHNDERNLLAVTMAERFADGTADDVEREQARKVHRRVYAKAADHLDRAAFWAFREILAKPIGFNAESVFCNIVRVLRTNDFACPLLREVLGNPFHPITLDPAWRTQTVTQFAQAIYDERAFDRLPILADALEEAGCTDTAILDHLRGPGPHVRGCWALELMLGLS